MMPIYKKIFFAIAGAAFLIMILAVVYWAAHPRTLALPGADEVVMIGMEQFNEGSGLGPAVVTGRTNIGVVLSALSTAKKTLGTSVNDYPVSDNYLVVRIILKNERRTVCLYSEHGRYYAEEPYIGIYKSSREASVALYKIYNASTGVLPAGINE